MGSKKKLDEIELNYKTVQTILGWKLKRTKAQTKTIIVRVANCESERELQQQTQTLYFTSYKITNF